MRRIRCPVWWVLLHAFFDGLLLRVTQEAHSS